MSAAASTGVFVIAEAGVNHNGSLETAGELVRLAAEAGADAVKFQTFRADALVSPEAAKADYQQRTTGAGETQWQMLRRLELDADAHHALRGLCRRHGIEFMSSPFDEQSLRFLVEDCAVRRLKLGSGEVTNAPLLFAAARSGRPLVLSTGMATLGEVEEALAVLGAGYFGEGVPVSLEQCRRELDSARLDGLAERVTLLHCTTEYPAPPESVNLRAMRSLRDAFGLPVGFSDHTVGTAASVAAVSLGAVAIEKHFTLDRGMAGPDHAASLEPGELAELVAAVRAVAVMQGDGRKTPAPAERRNIPVARKSIVAARAVARGERFDEHNLATRRPATGTSAMRWFDLLGREAGRNYRAGEEVDP